jgi:hypothetical protein
MEFCRDTAMPCPYRGLSIRMYFISVESAVIPIPIDINLKNLKRYSIRTKLISGHHFRV